MTSQKQIEANRKNSLKSTGPNTPQAKAIVSANAVTHGLRAQHVVIDGESQDEFNEFRNESIQHFAPAGFLEQLLTDRITAACWRLRRVAQIEVELLNNFQQPKPIFPTDPCNNEPQDHELPVHLKVVKTYPANFSSNHLGQHSADETKACLNELKDTLKQISHTNISTKHVPALRQYLIDLSGVDSFIDSLSPENQNQLNKAIDELTQIENALKTQPIDDMWMKFTLGRAIQEDAKNLSTLNTLHRYETSIQRTLFKSLHELQRFQAARQGRPVSPPATLDINIT